MVNVDLYSAIIKKVFNALNTLVSGEKPGVQAPCKGLIVLLCAELSGKEFQTMGPCTANARRPTVDSRCSVTTISCSVADLRRCLSTTLVTGVQQSTRYCGALPCRHLLFRRLFVPRHHCCSSAATSRRHCFSHRTLHHSVRLCDRL